MDGIAAVGTLEGGRTSSRPCECFGDDFEEKK
jgi:hypothetical protein